MLIEFSISTWLFAVRMAQSQLSDVFEKRFIEVEQKLNYSDANWRMKILSNNLRLKRK